MSESIGPGKGWRLTLRIVGATFAVLSTPIGFSVFALLFHNYYAGIVNIFVGIMGGFNLHLHMSFKTDRLFQNYSDRGLTRLKWLSVGLGGVALVSALVFFVLAVVWKTGIHPIKSSMVLPGIQSLVVFQECALHYYFRRKYVNILSESDRAQLTPSEETPHSDNLDTIS